MQNTPRLGEILDIIERSGRGNWRVLIEADKCSEFEDRTWYLHADTVHVDWKDRVMETTPLGNQKLSDYPIDGMKKAFSDAMHERFCVFSVLIHNGIIAFRLPAVPQGNMLISRLELGQKARRMDEMDPGLLPWIREMYRQSVAHIPS